MRSAAAQTFPFLNLQDKDGAMDKSRTIQIMTKSVQLYEEHLKEQKVLFLYGLVKAVKKQLQENGGVYRLYKEMKLLFTDTTFYI